MSKRRMLDNNGYAESILPTEDRRCYLCLNVAETVRHEIYYGTANRRLSKREGCWVNLCPRCHEEVHKRPNEGCDGFLKRNAQWYFEKNSSREEFVEIFGRNYI